MYRKNLIYHYTSLSTGMEYILQTMRLKISSFNMVNDPKEYRDSELSFLSYGTFMDDFSYEKMEKINKNINNHKFNTKMVCFSIDEEDVEDYHRDFIYQNYYKRGFCLPRMWSQYGDNNRGMCFGFEKEKLIDSVKESVTHKENVHHGNVIYTNDVNRLHEATQVLIDKENCSESQEEIVEIHIKKNFQDIYFTKLQNWRDENEYRIIYLGENHEDLFVQIDDSIKVIYLGLEFPHIYQQLVEKLCRLYKIDLYKLELRNYIVFLNNIYSNTTEDNL